MHTGGQIIHGLKVLFLSLILLLCISALAGAAELIGSIKPKMQGEQLIRALKKGEYVVYFRHGATNKIGEKNVEKKDLVQPGVNNLSVRHTAVGAHRSI